MPSKVKVAEVNPGPELSDEDENLLLKSDHGMDTVNGTRVTENDLIADTSIIHGIDQLGLPPPR